MICKNCQKVIAESSKFCPFCAARVETTLDEAPPAPPDETSGRCPNCQREIPRNTKFCPFCATRLDAPPAAPGQTPPAAVHTAAPARQTPGKKRKGVYAIVTACVLILAAGAAAVIFFMRGRQEKDQRLTAAPEPPALVERDEGKPEGQGALKSLIKLAKKPAGAEPPEEAAGPESEPAPEPEPEPEPAPEPESEPEPEPEPEPALEPEPEPAPEPSRVLQIDPAAVGSLVEGQAGGATWAFAVMDIATGDIAGSERMGEPLSSSALLNIPVLYAVACMNSEDTEQNLPLDTPVRINRATAGRSVLANRVGQSLPLQELLGYMLQYSDNTASNTLMERLTFQAINDCCVARGYTSVSLNNYILSTTDYTENDNYVGCADLCGMLTELYNDQFPGIGSQFLRQYMVIQDAAARSGLGRYAPDSVSFMNLNGQKADKYNEVAIVDDNAGHAYVIAFMGSRAGMDRLSAAAQACGQYLYGVLGIQ